MRGMLTNIDSVHLKIGVEDTEITVQLPGPKSRAVFTIVDKDCLPYKEQSLGMTIHHLSEYPDLCR